MTDYTLYPKGDRENLLPLEPKLGSLFVLQLFTINLFTQPGAPLAKAVLLLQLSAPSVVPLAEKDHQKFRVRSGWHHYMSINPKNIKIRWGGLGFYSFFTARCLSFRSSQAIGFSHSSSLPARLLQNWGSYAVSLPQHCGLKENDPDFRKCTRSIKLNPLAEFLYWRMNWHIEHHMFAGVPCYNLKKLHRLIAEDMPELRTFFGAWREMRETWQRQKTDPDYFFDTPLPPTAQHIPTEAPDVLESSIGELAPKGLK